MPQGKKNYLVRAGIIPNNEPFTDELSDRFDLRITGVNHFTWILKAEFDGRDITPQIAESFKQSAAAQTEGGGKSSKAISGDAIVYELYKIFGYIPAMVGHTKEYVRYW
ncbi:MAG: glycoside hydrolase family 4 [Paenibacillaceae bacterium]|jgi:alpha-galactosidase|nr:glycoside hydrolase family 4 [Paenibacillaceae bacterium]